MKFWRASLSSACLAKTPHSKGEVSLMAVQPTPKRCGGRSISLARNKRPNPVNLPREKRNLLPIFIPRTIRSTIFLSALDSTSNRYLQAWDVVEIAADAESAVGARIPKMWANARTCPVPTSTAGPNLSAWLIPALTIFAPKPVFLPSYLKNSLMFIGLFFYLELLVN
jgi:hypothetical protein